MIRIQEEDLPEPLRVHDAVDDPPDNDRYVLLYFSNFGTPCIGRFDSGNYFIGDELDTCISQDLFVSGWREILAWME